MAAEDQPQNPYQAARERMRQQDRVAAAAYSRRPFGPFIAKAVAKALVAGFVGYLLGGWTNALFLFVAWLLTDLGVRIWARRRYGGKAEGEAGAS
jgi:hypothetical protein